MTEGGDPDKLGRGAVWNGEIPNCIHQNHVFAIRPDPKRLAPEYLSYLTRTPYARAYFEATATKTTGIASTSSRKIAAWPIPLPTLKAQADVVARVRAEEGKATIVVDRLTRQLSLLREHRQALITAAVTGQMDVGDPVA
jgi:type I restriction enzyme S subunit